MSARVVIQIIKNPSYFAKLADGDKTEELALLAVLSDPNSLEFISRDFQTVDVCLAALKKCSLTLKFIQEPTLCQYKTAILRSHKDAPTHETLAIHLDMIPLQDILNISSTHMKVLYYIVENTSSYTLYQWLKKVPLTFWTEDVIFDLLENIANRVRIEFFIKFLSEFKIKLDDRVKKRFLTMCMFGSDLFEIDGDLVKWAIINNYIISEELVQKWTSAIDLTFIDFYKIRAENRIVALTLCKTLTNDMILLSSIDDHWGIIKMCLKKNLLTPFIMCDIFELVLPEKTKIVFEDFDYVLYILKLVGWENLNKLCKINFTVDQLIKINNKCIHLAEFLRIQNPTFQTHNKVIIIDNVAKSNHEAEKWNIVESIINARLVFGDSITYAHFDTKSMYKIYTNNTGVKTKIRSVFVLN